MSNSDALIEFFTSFHVSDLPSVNVIEINSKLTPMEGMKISLSSLVLVYNTVLCF